MVSCTFGSELLTATALIFEDLLDKSVSLYSRKAVKLRKTVKHQEIHS